MVGSSDDCGCLRHRKNIPYKLIENATRIGPPADIVAQRYGQCVSYGVAIKIMAYFIGHLV